MTIIIIKVNIVYQRFKLGIKVNLRERYYKPNQEHYIVLRSIETDLIRKTFFQKE